MSRSRIGCRILNAVIPAQAGIQNHDVSEEREQRRASFCPVGGYGSRALLRGPGMTVLGWSDDPGSALRFVRDDAGGWVVKEPAPVGPQRELRACEVIEGGAWGSPARWLWKGKSQTALRARFVSADLEACQDRPPAITGVRDLRRDRACSHTATPRERAPLRNRSKQPYSSA